MTIQSKLKNLKGEELRKFLKEDRERVKKLLLDIDVKYSKYTKEDDSDESRMDMVDEVEEQSDLEASFDFQMNDAILDLASDNADF